MKKFYLLVMLIVGMSCLDAGAKTEKVWMEKPSGKMVEEARTSTKQVSIVDVKKLWDGDEDIVPLVFGAFLFHESWKSTIDSITTL